MKRNTGPLGRKPGVVGRDSGALSIAAVAVVLLAAVLRFWNLGRTSFWFDELFVWDVIVRPWPDMMRATLDDTHPPLFNSLAWVWLRVFGESESALRMLPALLGTASVWFLYLVGRQLRDQRTGLLSASLLAISGFHIWYSQEFRNYALLSFSAVVFIHALFLVACGGRLPQLFYLVIATVLLLYSHVFGLFLFAAVFGFLCLAWLLQLHWREMNYKHSLAALSMAGLIYGFWAWRLPVLKNSVSIAWIPELDAYQLFSQLALLFNGPLAAILLCGMALFWLLACVAWPWWKSGSRMAFLHQHLDECLVVTWLAAPIVAALVISLAGKPLFMARYLILSLPAMCLVAALALQKLVDRRLLLGLLSVALAATLSWSAWYAHQRDRPDHRGAIELVRENFQPGDKVVLSRINTWSLGYYWPGWRFSPVPLADHDDPWPQLNALAASGRTWAIVRRKETHWPRPPLYSAGTRLGDIVITRGENRQGFDVYLLEHPSPGHAVKQ